MNSIASQFTPSAVHETAKYTGLVLMTLATTLGMIELPEHPNSKVALNAQSAVYVTEQGGAERNIQRRERDESAPHYISYSAFQRTPGRTGKY